MVRHKKLVPEHRALHITKWRSWLHVAAAAAAVCPVEGGVFAGRQPRRSLDLPTLHDSGAAAATATAGRYI